MCMVVGACESWYMDGCVAWVSVGIHGIGYFEVVFWGHGGDIRQPLVPADRPCAYYLTVYLFIISCDEQNLSYGGTGQLS